MAYTLREAATVPGHNGALWPAASPAAPLALAEARVTQVEAELRLTLAEERVSHLEAELAATQTQRDAWMMLAQQLLLPKRSWWRRLAG
jgi:hypothetical protein